MIGTLLDGKYLVKRQIGSGAMGAVYEAEHAATGRRVAVKVISAGEMTRDQMMISRFQREARAAGGIDTQHITQVLDAGVDSGSGLPFLVMEFMTGEDIQQLIKRVGVLSPDLALRICAQACLGLQKAHEANVVHRDIKPANLFLARRDAGESIVKLLDFGIAKVKMEQAQEAENAELTRTGRRSHPGCLWRSRTSCTERCGTTRASASRPPQRCSAQSAIEPVIAKAPPAPTEAPPPTDLSLRRMKVVIMPADAQAEIEGEKALVKLGVLEISGVLGSVRRVRIFKGKAETTVDVIVTESGPSPPKIELTFGGPKPAASATSSTGPASSAAPKPGIVTEFE